MTAAELDDLYRLLAIAKYDDRYVIPTAHAEDAGRLMAQHARSTVPAASTTTAAPA